MKKYLLIFILLIFYTGLTSFNNRVDVYKSHRFGMFPSEYLILKYSVAGPNIYDYFSPQGQFSILGTWERKNDSIFLYPNSLLDLHTNTTEELEKCPECILSRNQCYVIKGDSIINIEDNSMLFKIIKNQ